jgi:hypothetical protein
MPPPPKPKRFDRPGLNTVKVKHTQEAPKDTAPQPDKRGRDEVLTLSPEDAKRALLIAAIVRDRPGRAPNSEKEQRDLKAIIDEAVRLNALAIKENAKPAKNVKLGPFGFLVPDYYTDDIGESNNPDYIDDEMDAALDIELAEAILCRVYPAEDVKEALKYLAAKAARETTSPATADPRPDAAAPTPGNDLEWPSEKWKDSPEKIRGRKNGIVNFLKREWEPFIKASGTVVTQDTLAAHDVDAERALSRHLETHDFPKGLSIVYPKHFVKIIEGRPDLVRAALG